MDGTTGKPAVSTTSGFSGSSKGGVFSRKKAKYFGIGMVISRNSPSTTTSSLVPELHFMLFYFMRKVIKEALTFSNCAAFEECLRSNGTVRHGGNSPSCLASTKT